jgi:leucyl/phenylalanyl-tRNA--protein transferase
MMITPQRLLNAYCQGVFPMADPDKNGRIYWYDPNPRTIIPLESYHLSRSLQRTLKKGMFDIRCDTQFRRVMEACAEPAPGREKTWISRELIELYCQLHDHGFAHSVESYQQGELVGGVYGVSIRGLFAAESMFSRVTDASKVALACLLEHLSAQGYALFDVQFMTEHLRRFGAREIPREEYQQRLLKALSNSLGWNGLAAE